MVRAQNPQTANKRCHLWRGEAEKLCAINEHLLCRDRQFALGIVAEAVDDRLHHVEAFGVSLLRSCVHTTAGKRHGHSVTTGLCGGFHSGCPAQHNHIRQGYVFAVVCGDAFQGADDFGQKGGFVHVPILLRCQTHPRTVCPTAMVGPTISRGRRPSDFHQISDAQTGSQDLRLQVGHFRIRQGRCGGCRQGILPDQVFRWDFWAFVADLWTHIPVQQLKPSARKGVFELVWVGVVIAGDRLIRRVHTHRHVGGCHHRRVGFGWIVCIRHSAFAANCGPLVCACGGFGQLPFVAKQSVEIAHIPLRWRRIPRAFDTRCDRVVALAGAVTVLPAQAHLMDGGSFGFSPNQLRVAVTVCLTKGVTTGDKRHCFRIIHTHAGKGVADVKGGLQRVRIAVWAFWVHVDQTHLHSSERVFEITLTGIAAVLTTGFFEPDVFGSPVNVFLRRPCVRTTTAETKCLVTHGFHRDVPGQQEQVGPRNGVAVLLLDRPQKAAGFIKVAVVRPGIQGCEPLLTGIAATTTIRSSVGASGVPGHAYKERAVMAVVRGPPVLAVSHQRNKVGLQRRIVELFEGLSIINHAAEWVELRVVLVQHLQVQLIWPPFAVGPRFVGHLNRFAMHHWALTA